MAWYGSANSGVDSTVSMSLFGCTSAVCAPPKSKNVCQPMNRRGARKPPRRSSGSVVGFCAVGDVDARVEDQAEERLAVVAGQVRAVGRAHHAVPEPVGGAGELDRDERLPARPEVRRPGVQHVVDQRLADEHRQDPVDHQPLVVPGGQPAGGREGRRSGRPRPPRRGRRRGCGTSRNAACSPEMIRLLSLRRSPMTAESSARRGRSSNRPPDSSRSLIGWAGSYSSRLEHGPPPYTRVEVEAGACGRSATSSGRWRRRAWRWRRRSGRGR